MTRIYGLIKEEDMIYHDSELAYYEGSTSLILKGRSLEEVLEIHNKNSELSERQEKIVTDYYNYWKDKV